MGHRQTVQIQIRCCMMFRVIVLHTAKPNATVSLYKVKSFQQEVKKNPHNTHKIENGFVQLIWVGNSVRHKKVIFICMFSVDQIYHLASPASPPNYMYNPVKTLKTNTVGTINMLGKLNSKACVKRPLSKRLEN